MKFSYPLIKKLVPKIKNKAQAIKALNLHAFETKDGPGDAFEVSIPPNRYSDAASHMGLAREAAAILNLRLKIRNPKSEILNKSQTQNSKFKTNDEILKIAASLEQRSEHPLGKAIVEKAKEEKFELFEVSDFEAVPGKGIKGNLLIDGDNVSAALGNREMLKVLGLDIKEMEPEIQELENDGKTVMILVLRQAQDKLGDVVGLIAVADILKPEAKEAIKKLKQAGLEIWMITGDNERTAQAIGKQVGIENIMAQVLPQNKALKVQELQKQGKKVAAIGDGINDGPMLAQANLGIAMGEGTDVAMESAGVTLMRGNLNLIAELFSLSRRTLQIVKQNLFWAFFYNTAFIPVAAGALYPFFGAAGLLNPIFAAAAMAFSSLSVVLNSLRLKRS